jgi:alpha-tubulin suppressor-like RCC1 family protein
LGACASLVPSRSTLGGVFAEKGDTRPFDMPLPVNTAHKKLALGYSISVGVKEDGTVWSWGGRKSWGDGGWA